MIESFCCDFCQHAARGYRGLFPKRYSIRLYLARCIWVQTLTTVYLFFAISGMCFSQAQPRKDVALELVRSAVLRSGLLSQWKPLLTWERSLPVPRCD